MTANRIVVKIETMDDVPGIRIFDKEKTFEKLIKGRSVLHTMNLLKKMYGHDFGYFWANIIKPKNGKDIILRILESANIANWNEVEAGE